MLKEYLMKGFVGNLSLLALLAIGGLLGVGVTLQELHEEKEALHQTFLHTLMFDPTPEQFETTFRLNRRLKP